MFVTVNWTPLLGPASVLTTTGPEVAPSGTCANMRPSCQIVGVPCTPLKVTVLKGLGAPKFDPVMSTGAGGTLLWSDGVDVRRGGCKSGGRADDCDARRKECKH